jgi:hypothetical protein
MTVLQISNPVPNTTVFMYFLPFLKGFSKRHLEKIAFIYLLIAKHYQ